VRPIALDTNATADLYALVYAVLRRKGQPIPTNDLWIACAAYCDYLVRSYIQGVKTPNHGEQASR
jgi:predicted nucleic acid-binding protein